jgi:sialate O-acetylesterase
MTVSAGAETITLQNLLVGDVWLCSGQSNMEMDFNNSQYQADMPAFINPDNLPSIRHIKITKSGALFPQKQLPRGNASWTVCNSSTVPGYTAAGFFFAYFVNQQSGVPIGLINSTSGNSNIGEWVSPDGIGLVTDQIPASSFRATYGPEPCRIYYSQIAPLRGYPLKGGLWYQGENNGGEGSSYYWKMKALFQGWRNEWQQGDFPFYYAQLPSYDGSQAWAPTREAQRQALTITHTGMATLVDVGGVGLPWPRNLHPPNKYDVGRRLAQWALANEYGQTGLVTSGPLFKSAVFSGAKVTISYDHVGTCLVAARKSSPLSIDPPAPVTDLLGFELAGADNVWHAADAVIQGSTVVLSSASVPSPQSARYLYATNTDNGTLYNLENLPAAPFLTTAADTRP